MDLVPGGYVFLFSQLEVRLATTALRAGISKAAPATAGRPTLRLSTSPKVLLYSHDTFGLGNIPLLTNLVPGLDQAEAEVPGLTRFAVAY